MTNLDNFKSYKYRKRLNNDSLSLKITFIITLIGKIVIFIIKTTNMINLFKIKLIF